MIEADKRKAVFLLHQEGMSINEIVRRLQLSRNTVRTILKQKGEMPAQVRKRKVRIEAELLERLYRDCDGWAQRVFFFSSRRRHTRLTCDWSSDVCSSD